MNFRMADIFIMRRKTKIWNNKIMELLAHVYIIRNLINDKMYVGKSVDTASRWSDHKKVALGGKEKYPNDFFAIHAAIAKYGLDNFKFEIIESFETEDEAFYFETWWVEFLETYKKSHGYNCNYGGEGGVRPTEESRDRMRRAQSTPEIRKAKSDRMKKRHEENPGFLSEVHKGNQ